MVTGVRQNLRFHLFFGLREREVDPRATYQCFNLKSTASLLHNL